MNEANRHTPQGTSKENCRSLSVPLLNITQRNAERKLLSLMELGNPTFLAAQMDLCIAQRYADAITDLASCALTQAKYQGIAFTNLARRSAMLAGVSEKAAHAISDSFSARYAAMTDPAQQWTLATEMLISFSSSIRDANMTPYSPTVRQCCEYIDDVFHAPISLSELGEICGLTAHYISDLFRRELGMGALQYIHQVKLQHAKYLLEHSDLSIAEISFLLSYPSHSNFSQQFKKNYGVTPHEYRTISSQ